MPVKFVAPKYPELTRRPGFVSLDCKSNNEKATWKIIPGKMFIDSVRSWNDLMPSVGTSKSMVHIFDLLGSMKQTMKYFVEIDLNEKLLNFPHGTFMPQSACNRTVERAGRWLMGNMEGFVHEVMEQAGPRQLEDSKLLFSVTGRGHAYSSQEYLDGLEDGKRDHVWCYGARMTSHFAAPSYEWDSWTDHYSRWERGENGWTKEPPTKPMRRLLYSMPGGMTVDDVNAVVWKKGDIHFKIPSNRMVWCLIARNHINDMDWGVIQRSSLYNIRKGLRAVCAHMRRPNLRKVTNLGDVCAYINEIRPRPRHTVYDWAMDSIAWHADAELREERAQQERQRRDAERSALIDAAKVPVFTRKLPRGFKQLTELSEFKAESGAMEHCVDSYWEGAKLGQYFIVHYSGMGTPCTLQVRHDGTIIQSRGLRNKTDYWTETAAQKLSAWCSKGKFFNKEDVTLTEVEHVYGELPF